MSIPAQIKYAILSILFVVAAFNFTRTTLDILQSSKRLEDLKGEVAGLEKSKTDLQEDIKYKQTEDFIEERARDALNLIKPGEKVYVSPVVLGAETAPTDRELNKETEPKSNTQMWLDLFF